MRRQDDMNLIENEITCKKFANLVAALTDRSDLTITNDQNQSVLHLAIPFLGSATYRAIFLRFIFSRYF